MPVTRRIRKPKTRVAARLQLQNRHREVKAVEIEVVVVNKVVPNVLVDGGSGHQFIVPRAQQKAMDWTDHKVVWGWENLDDRWFTANYNSDNGIWPDVPCNNNWQPGKQPDMMVWRCQRCCTQLNTSMEHVQKHAYLNCRTTWNTWPTRQTRKSHGSILKWSWSVPTWIALNTRNPTYIGRTWSIRTLGWLDSIHVA